MKGIRKNSLLATLSVMLFLLTVPPLYASSVTQGFKATSTIPKGAIVSLKQEGSNEIEKSTIDNDRYMIGVVVEGADSLVDVRPKDSDISVAVSGEVDILATNLNGDIESGDLLIASTLAGIAVKDEPPAPGVKYIAVAASELSGATTGAKTVSVELTDGGKKDVKVALIKAKILLGSRQQASKDETAVESFGRKLTGKAVSAIQLIAATAVFLSVVVLVGVVLYSSIRNSFISLGRNPLSRSSVVASLVKVIVVAVFVLAAGVGVAYGILLL
jgi:hypothetical protein